MHPNILTFLNHMTTQSYQDEIVDPVIRKICDKLDANDFIYSNGGRSITVVFGDSCALLYEGLTKQILVDLDEVHYDVINALSLDLLSIAFNKKLNTEKLKAYEEKRKADIIKNAVKNILEDGIKKPYVQRF